MSKEIIGIGSESKLPILVVEEMQSKFLDLTNKLKSERILVKKFREESAIYKSSVEDMEECMRQENEASDLKVKNFNLSLTELQRTHETLISVHEDFKIKFHMISKERIELFQKIPRAYRNKLKTWTIQIKPKSLDL